MKFIEHLRARGEGKENPTPPWHLHDKLRCYDFCNSVGIPTVKVLRKFDTPDAIDFHGLPNEFVLKPTYQSSSIGVMVLTKTETGYHDAMTGKDFTFAEIVAKQRKIHDESDKAVKPVIVEELVKDKAGNPIPEDFKAYALQGEIAFILQMNRNGGKTQVAWYDGNFEPITDDSVDTNTKYLTLMEHNKPADWEGLLHLARRASTAAPTPFASIDMYASTRGPVLGEITLVPGGFYFGKYFVPSEKQDLLVGEMWDRALVRLGR